MKWYWIVIIIISVSALLWVLYKESTTKEIKDKIKNNLSKIPHEYDTNIKMNDLFDRIYLIAIPKRKEYALKALSSFDIRPKLIDPIWKDDLSYEDLIKNDIIDPNYNYKNMGRVACHLSHLKTLRTFLQDPTAQTALIFEDDIKGCSDKANYKLRLSSLKEELNYVDGKWDILYLGGDSSACMTMKPITYQIYSEALPYCLHAYVITRKGAQIVLEEGLPMYAYGDWMYRDLVKNGKLNALSVVPSLFVQNRSELGTHLDSFEKVKECKEFPFWNTSLDSSQDRLKLTQYRVTVVIPNYSRPHNLDILIPKLKEMPEIDQIIIAHGNPKTYKKFPGVTNIQNFDINDLYGAAQRFFVIGYAKNDMILSLDDDHVPSRAFLQKLLKEAENDPVNIYGPYKRLCTSNGYFVKSPDYNIIITPITLIHKLIIQTFIRNFDKYAPVLKRTKGNGEDISLNHHLHTVYGKHPVYVNGEFSTLDEDTGSYRRKKSHITIRNKLCKQLDMKNN